MKIKEFRRYMRIFRSQWLPDVSEDEFAHSIKVVCRPGSEVLCPAHGPLVFPFVESQRGIDPTWPRWGIGTLKERFLILVLAPANSPVPEGMKWQEIRSLLPILSQDELEALCRAAILVSWNDEHRYCGHCGHSTALDQKETFFGCPSCKHRSYPRISPAMIVRITDGKRILLAHNRNFKEGIYSCVAGYVDPGETLERSVLREIEEEVNLRASPPRYIISQSWPFPNSLMMGFETTARGDPIPDGEEITDARWFDAHSLPAIPRQGSLARYLIDQWLAGQ